MNLALAFCQGSTSSHGSSAPKSTSSKDWISAEKPPANRLLMNVWRKSPQPFSNESGITVPKFDLILKPGEPIPEEFAVILHKRLSPAVREKLLKHGGLIRLSVATPYVDRK